MQNATSIQLSVSAPGVTGVQLVTSTVSWPSPVVLTQYLTETANPILTYTQDTTITNDPVTEWLTSDIPTSIYVSTSINPEAVQSDPTSTATSTAPLILQSNLPQASWTESIQSETQQETTQEAQQTRQTPWPTPIAYPMPSWTTSEILSSYSSSSKSGQSYAEVTTSESNLVPLASASITSLSPPSSVTVESSMITNPITNSPVPDRGAGLEVITSSQGGTDVQSSTTSTSSPLASVTSSSAFSGDAPVSPHMSPRRVGAIVGSVVGGIIFIALALLACLLFRRRRRSDQNQRKHSRQTILRTDLHNSTQSLPQHRQPSWPIPCSSVIPSAPVFPPRRSDSSPDTWASPAPAILKQDPDLSQDTMYPCNGYQKQFTDGPAIEVFPPSHSASIYSRPSWDSGHKYPDQYDDSSGGFAHGNIYLPGVSRVTPPALPGNDTPNSTLLVTPKRRASIRSNPFDLEAPPSAASKGFAFGFSTGPPNPTWGH